MNGDTEGLELRASIAIRVCFFVRAAEAAGAADAKNTNVSLSAQS